MPREDLANAVALQTLAFNTAATLGPTLAGASVAALGFSGTFLLNALSFLGVLAALVYLRVPGRPRREAQERLSTTTLFASSREGDAGRHRPAALFTPAQVRQ